MVQAIHVFTKQAIPMVWDFAEPNLFGEGMGDYNVTLDNMMRVIPKLPENNAGFVVQADAAKQDISFNKVISTDPPYYDNVPYADLSDFFYFWLRKPLKSVLPEFYSTISIPKTDELVADRKRHGSKNDAERFFLEGMTNAMSQIARLANPAFPTTIYYAFKQSEKSEKGSASTGWETFLEAVISSGLEIVGTWPMRTELANRMRGLDSNALASSIVMVCVKREPNAESTSRRQFQRELREHMPQALEDMIGGTLGASPIAPVDLAQSAIGPGMAIYSKYEAVLNQDGSKMSVHDALVLINRAITECLNPDSGNFDNDTLFCDDWFSQYGWSQGQFGEADTLARAKGTSVDGVRDAGVIESGGGKVRLLKWSEYPTHWDPKADTRIPVWEACHQMIRVLNQQGEAEAGSLLARMPELGEHIRQLAYHLYTLCERKKWAEEARAYNELIGSWHAIVAASHEVGHRGTQSELGLDF
jgi:putative DNA methylase